jgi:DNA-binding response OmpR family regulator
MSRDRVMVVVPAEEFQEICKAFPSGDVYLEHASSVLGAVLEYAYERQTKRRPQADAPIILCDADSVDDWRAAVEACRRLNSASRVIVVSRKADEQMWIQVLEIGGYDLLPKPIAPHAVRSAVRSAMLSVASPVAAAA